MKFVFEHRIIFVQPECSTGVTSKLDRILTLLGEIKMVDQATKDEMTAVEAEQQRLKTDIQALRNTADGLVAQLAAALANPPTDTDPAFLARLQAVHDGLAVMASDVEQTVTADTK